MISSGSKTAIPNFFGIFRNNPIFIVSRKPLSFLWAQQWYLLIISYVAVNFKMNLAPGWVLFSYTLLKKEPHIIPCKSPESIGSIYSILIDQLYPYPDNPFGIRDDPSMLELTKNCTHFFTTLWFLCFNPVALSRINNYNEYDKVQAGNKPIICLLVTGHSQK